MTSEVQEPDPSGPLLDTARSVVPGWLRIATLDAAARGGVVVDPDDPELADMIAATTTRLLDELDRLLRTDVDRQRSNPLSLFRAAVAGPTAWLRDRGVPAPPSDGFEGGLFPDDVYRLGPATWSDVHPDLHEPGLTWGAWKAITVLRRRRDEGLR